MKSKKRILFMVLLALSMLMLAPATVSAAVKSVQITGPTKKSSYTVNRETKIKTLNLKVKVTVTNGSSKAVKYKSSNPSVVRVSSKGKLTIRKKGTATITVTSKANSKKKDTIKIKVYQKVHKLTLSLADKSIYVGETTKLSTKVEPSNANNKKVRYRSVDPSIATVTQSGVVTGKKAGKVKLTVRAYDNQWRWDTIWLTVKGVRMTDASLSADAMSIKEAESRNISSMVTVTPSLAEVTKTYKSADTSIATVTSAGVVKGVSKGTTTITVTIKDKNYGNTITKELRVDVAAVDYTKLAMVADFNRTYADVTINWHASDIVDKLSEVFQQTSAIKAGQTLGTVNAVRDGSNVQYVISVDTNKRLKITSNGNDVTNLLNADGTRTYSSITVAASVSSVKTLLSAMESMPSVSTNLTFSGTCVIEGQTLQVEASGIAFNQTGYSTATIAVNGQPTTYQFYLDGGDINIKSNVTSNLFIMKLEATGSFAATYYAE